MRWKNNACDDGYDNVHNVLSDEMLLSVRVKLISLQFSNSKHPRILQGNKLNINNK